VVSLLLEAGADWRHRDTGGAGTALQWAQLASQGNVHTSPDAAAAVLGAWGAQVMP
jgi:hypothetical protein